MPLSIRPLILIVFNDSAVRDSLAHPLIEMGYHVRVTPDGVSAFEVAKKIAPDIVISQMEMSGMDGLSLCQQIKSTASLQACHFVLVTERDADIVDIGRITEPDDYLVLPVALFELTSRVRTGYRALNSLRSEHTDSYELYSEINSEVTNIAFEKATSGLRHEINNPLFAISGSVEGLIKQISMLKNEDGIGTDDLLARLKRISIGAERIREVVSNFTYSKIMMEQNQSPEYGSDLQEVA